MNPLVSVRVITYNHERYITRCLDGLLMQKTDFPYEIVIGEDCSTDGTRDIVMRYQARHPDIIRVITSETNVGAFNNSSRVCAASRGKYHAFCEGDDFWIDSMKLQKQVDLLEAHPDYSMCFHETVIIFESAANRQVHIFPYDTRTVIPIEDLILQKVSIRLASILAHAAVLESLPAWRAKVWAPDLVLQMWCAHQGKVGYLNEIMAVQIKHTSGMTSTTPQQKKYLDTLQIYTKFDQETGYRYTKYLQKAIRCARRSYHAYRMQRAIGYWYYVINPCALLRRLRAMR